MKLVTQEHPMGCAVACTASLIEKSYKKTLLRFEHPEYATLRGYFCKEICSVLSKSGKKYSWKKVNSKNVNELHQVGTFVFIERSIHYPAGHFLLKTKKGWMNPWINFPSIAPAKAGFQKELPGKPEWMIYSKD